MANPVTVELMRTYLERFGWSRYEIVDEPYEAEGLLRTGWRSHPEVEGFTLVIDPMVERECLSFRVIEVLSAPSELTDPEAHYQLMQALAFLNYLLIIGKFGYDPRDGEIRFSIDLPIDANTLTYEQFVHCLRVAILSTERYAPLLEAVRDGDMDFEEFQRKCQEEPVREVMQALRELLDEIDRALRSRRPEE